MTFFGLFQTANERRMRQRVKFRQGKLRIQKFVQQLEKSAREYALLAQKAHHLDDEEQFRQLSIGYLKARNGINRWERYLVKLNALEMRRNEVEATRDFLQSIGALTSTILNRVNPDDVACVQQDMEQAVLQSEQLEDALSYAMDETAEQIGRAETLDLDILEKITAAAEPTGQLTNRQAIPNSNRKTSNEQLLSAVQGHD